MWKKMALTVLVLALISVFIISPAEAGVRNRLKYLTVLGLLPPPPIPVPVGVYSPPVEPNGSAPQEYAPGHWEMIREWVPGTWERVWVPGYHNRWGRWVPGHYENRQTPGYYADRKVWVEGYYRP
jgi:hypothetical protein